MKTRKVVTILILMALNLLIFIPSVYASGVYSSAITQFPPFTPAPLDPTLSRYIGEFIAFLRNVSVIVTVVVITILGAKYMMGSVEEKVEYKKDYVNIVIGTLLISTIFSLVSAIFSVVESV